MEEKIFNKNIILLMAGSFFYMASPMLVTPLITGYSESLGASAIIMGIVGGLTNLCSLAFQPISGNIADRTSKYRVGVIGSLFQGFACIGYVFSGSPQMILLFRVMSGVGFSFCSVCFSTWIANLLPKNKVGFGMGLYGMMNALAMGISPAIGVAIYHRTGYRPALALSAVSAFIAFLLIQFVSDKGEALKKTSASLKEFKLVDRRVVPLALVVTCFTIPYCVTQSFIVRYSETRELSITVSLFFTIYAAALLISRMAMRNLFDKLSYKLFLGICSVSALISISTLSIMSSNLTMFIAAVFMSGGYGLMCTVAQSNAITRVEPENRGLANGTYYIGMNSGMAFGPMLGGLLYGNVAIEYFYPILLVFVPLAIILYHASSKIIK